MATESSTNVEICRKTTSNTLMLFTFQVRSFSSLIVTGWSGSVVVLCIHTLVIVQGQRFNGTCMRGQKYIIVATYYSTHSIMQIKSPPCFEVVV